MKTIGRERSISMLALLTVQIVLLALIGRVVYFQIYRSPKLIKKALRQQIGKRPMLAKRGTIRDCRGRILAGTTIRPGAFVDPAIIRRPQEVADAVAPLLGLDRRQVLEKITAEPNKRFVYLKRHLDKLQAHAIEQLRIRGLGTINQAVRSYPMDNLAAHVLGYVSTDGKGLDGLEFKHDKILQGTDGYEQFVMDATGRPIWLVNKGYKPPQDGQHLIITIDTAIQGFAEQALDQACRKFKAAAGVALVMDPKTGEVLAMANWPMFDPNKFSTYGPEVRRNRAITDPFEPGSVFKPFIAAAALASGEVQWDETIFCYEGEYTVGRRVLHDHHPYGNLTFPGIVIHSSNIGMGILGLRLGNSRIHQALAGCRFGSKTGIELPGESAGIVLPLRTWTDYSTTSLPMGQEIAVTAIQLITAFSALANDGLMCKPKIVRGIMDNKGQIVRDLTEPQIVGRSYSMQIARAMVRGVLTRVVSEGTGRNAKIDGLQVFGKTGTAQVPKQGGGGYLPNKYVGSFVGGAPADDPQVVILVSIREPDRKIGYYGGTVAAPAFRKILTSTAEYLSLRKRPSKTNR